MFPPFFRPKGTPQQPWSLQEQFPWIQIPRHVRKRLTDGVSGQSAVKPPPLTSPQQRSRSQQANTPKQITQPQASTSKQNEQVLEFFPPLPKPHIPVGGRLKHFLSAWYSLSKDPAVIEMVTGCSINLIKTPSQPTVREIKMSKKELDFAVPHIEELISKNAICRSFQEEGDYVSPVFLCPKKDNSYHLILSLKSSMILQRKYHSKWRLCLIFCL